MSVFNFFRRTNWQVLAPVFLLSLFGLFGVLSATFNQVRLAFFWKQLTFICLGLVVFFVFRQINWRFLKNESKPLLFIYGLSLLSLVGLFFLGTQIRGAASWYKIGPFGLEPVELVKIVLVLVLAKYFSHRHVEMFRIKNVIVSFLYAGLPLLLVLMQPDLGSAMILGGIWFAVVLMSGMKIKHLVAVLFLIIVLVVLAWNFVLIDYQKDRITSFLDPQRDPYGSSYNLLQSLISVGSGGFWGRGFGQGGQTQLGFLPESHSDFIFASLCEELGFLGSSIILLLYFFFLFSIVRLSQKMPDNFSRLVLLGFTAMFFIEFVINVGMNVGLLPITGTPLPFLSSGGSNLISSFMAVGIISSLARRQVSG